jgi:hypothetical protein
VVRRAAENVSPQKPEPQIWRLLNKKSAQWSWFQSCCKRHIKISNLAYIIPKQYYILTQCQCLKTLSPFQNSRSKEIWLYFQWNWYCIKKTLAFKTLSLINAITFPKVLILSQQRTHLTKHCHSNNITFPRQCLCLRNTLTFLEHCHSKKHDNVSKSIDTV